MEKRKVRIYKAPDGKGQYINKTAKFLRKAATGGVADPDAYYNELIKTAYVSIKNNKDVKDLYDTFLAQNLAPEQIKKLLSDVYGLMIDNGEINPIDAQLTLDDLETQIESEGSSAAPVQDESLQAADENEEASEASDDDAEQMNQYRQQSMAIAMQPGDEEEFANETDDRSYLGYQYGGPLMMDEGGEYEDDEDAVIDQFNNQMTEDQYTGDIEDIMQTTPGMQQITFPGIENYLYDYQPIFDGQSINYLQPFENSESEEPEYKFGGPYSKKRFIKNVMKLVKKAEGDEIQHTETATPMDDLTNTVKDKKSSFINSVRYSANEAKIGEMHDQMQQQQNVDPMMQPQAARGGMISPRQYRKMYKAITQAQRAAGMSNYDAQVRLPYSGFAGYYNAYAGMPGTGAISYPDLMRYYTSIPHTEVHSKDLMPHIQVLDTDIFGRPKNYIVGSGYRPSSQEQAEDSEMINNIKGQMYLPSDDAADADNEEMPEGYSGEEMPESYYSDREAIEEGLVPGMQFGGALTADTDMLTKFMYGQATQPELAKNVNDPYDQDMTESDMPEARFGRVARGLRNVLVPWNPIAGYAGSWKKQRGLPFYAQSGNPYLGSLQGARPVATHVDKTTFIGRRPKEWTEYYQTPGSIGSFDAGTMYKGSDGQMHYFNAGNNMMQNQVQTKSKKQTEPEEYNTDTSGMSGAARRAVRQGEREMQRNERRAARNPEGNVPFDINIPNRESSGSENLGLGTRMKMLGAKMQGAGRSDDDNLGLGTKLKMFGAKLSGADQYAKGGVPQYYPGGPTLLTSKPAFDQFKSQCPPGSMKDPQTGLCKNFAGEVVPNNQTATAATTFQQNTEGIGANNPMAYSGTNNLTGQNAMHFNAQGTGYENKGLVDLSKQDKNKGNLIGAKFRKKDMRNVDPEAGVNVFNMGVRGVTGLINRGNQNALEAQLYNQFNSNNLSSSQADKMRGHWVDLGSQLGQFEFDKMGQDTSGYSSYGRYGGQFEDGGEANMDDGVMINEPYPYYPESEDVEEPFQVAKSGGEKVTYMSEKQIREFLAAGGELEYL